MAICQGVVPLPDCHLWELWTESARDNRVTESGWYNGRGTLVANALTPSPGTQNAFSPVQIVYGMLTETWRQKLKKERKLERMDSAVAETI